MILDYNNIEANCSEMIFILTGIADECGTYEMFEHRIINDYEDGYTSRLYKHIAKQYGKEYLSQIGNDFEQWVRFIDFMLENSGFLNKGLKTRKRKHFDRRAFWEQHQNTKN